MEILQEIRELEEVAQKFTYTFQFVDGQPTVDIALKTIKEKIFTEIPLEIVYSQPYGAHSHQCCEIVQHWMTFYNLYGDPDDDTTNINIQKPE